MLWFHRAVVGLDWFDKLTASEALIFTLFFPDCVGFSTSWPSHFERFLVVVGVSADIRS